MRPQRAFVAGCAKSGTTWVQNLLNGHPHILATGEGGLAWRLIPTLQAAVAAFNQHQAAIGQPPHCSINDRQFTEIARNMGDSMMDRAIEESPGDPATVELFADKTPQHTQSLALLAGLYPEARFIVIVRDPRDAAASAMFHIGRGDERGPAGYAEHFVRTIWPANIIPVLQDAQTLGDRLLQLRYEDLHADEPAWTRRMLTHLGVDASDAAVEACLAAGDFRTRSGGRDRGEGDDMAFYRRGVVGDHRNHFDAAFWARCVGPIADLAKRVGYDLASAEPAVAASGAMPAA